MLQLFSDHSLFYINICQRLWQNRDIKWAVLCRPGPLFEPDPAHKKPYGETGVGPARPNLSKETRHIGTAHKPGHFRFGQHDQIFNIIYKIINLC